MDEKGPTYKREEDRRWREQVDSRLASLTTGENDQNDRLDSQDEEFRAFRKMLEGDPADKEDSGLKGDIWAIKVEVNKLRALMQPDSLGEGGILARIKKLEKKAEREERSADNRWAFWKAVTVAIISSGLIYELWPLVRDRSHSSTNPTVTHSKLLRLNGNRHAKRHPVEGEPGEGDADSSGDSED